jgi:hypothetical protein
MILWGPLHHVTMAEKPQLRFLGIKQRKVLNFVEEEKKKKEDLVMNNSTM